MTQNRPRVLVSCYACGPYYGSEVGMGWNWIKALSSHCQLTVLTESGFQADIEKEIYQFNDRSKPDFFFIDIGSKGRFLFWKQGDWRFYHYYKAWQLSALNVATELVLKKEFNIVHQLNMIGYREPGFLWQLPLPFIWGPVGGHAQMRWSYMTLLNPKDRIFYSARNVINSLQMRFSRRVEKAMQSAVTLIAATEIDRKAIMAHHKKHATVINETGVSVLCPDMATQYTGDGPLKICWCGFFAGRKALPLALHALKKVVNSTNIELHIIGYGPNADKWKREAKRLGLQSVCYWYGKVAHRDVLPIISRCHLLLFTSLQESTSNVVLEALTCGLPVICHDTCGFGNVINEMCGIKIPVRNPRESICLIASSLLRLYTNPNLLRELSIGALNRAKELLWEAKAQQVVDLYRQIM